MSLVTSNPNKQSPTTQELSAEQVANWLSQNNNFC